MAAQKKYTKTGLEKAVERYFASISRKVPLTERVDSGQKDDNGHVIYEDKPILNQLGEQIEVLEYPTPPGIRDLCIFLGIHGSTWSEWRDASKYPEFQSIIERVDDLLYADRQYRLLTDPKNARGVIFDLQVNHGCRAKTEVELGPRGAAAVAASSIPASERAALLREIAEEFGQTGEGDG